MRVASQRYGYRRVPVQPEAMQKMQVETLPAPARGWILNENPAFQQPAGALVLDNLFPEDATVRIRGGSDQWSDTGTGDPIISGFKYASALNFRMYFSTEDTIFDVTTGTATSIATGRSSGNCVASQLANQGGDWMLVANDQGDYLLRFDGTTWEDLEPASAALNKVTGPVGTTVEFGAGLSYVWKYKSRMFFIEAGTMNAWYLPLNAVGGNLELIPLSGACSRGGFLMFGATWSIDAGDGIDDKCIFVSSEGEVLIFTGSDPGDPNNWRQEGRYEVSRPMGMNAHVPVGGDILIATIDGVIPLSQAITKDREGLSLTAATRTIEPFWLQQVSERDDWPWTMCRWDETNALYVSLPGGEVGRQWCLVANIHSGAWCRYVGWDATCFVTINGLMYFGTQDGRVVQAEVTGKDEGNPYFCTYVGSWQHFGGKANQVTWRQARCTFQARATEPFTPQVSAAVDYNFVLPTPPNAGPDPGAALDVWDEGVWDTALWDADAPPLITAIRNTYWVSIGATGYSFAPIIQAQISQTSKPQVYLISLDAIADQMAVAV